MGRGSGKLTMKQIQKEKLRNLAFIQRNKGLTKKVSKFSKDFGVEACLIVYDGDGDRKPMTWPQNTATLQSMLTKYEQQKIVTAPKIFDAKDYFANKKNMVEAEISRLRKKITMKKFPTWNPSFHNMEKEQIKDFIGIVDAKIKACDQRISMMKNLQQSDDQTILMQKLNNIMMMMNHENVNVTNHVDKPQENVVSSHSSQIDLMNSIPQMQLISNDPLKTLNDLSGIVHDSTNHFSLVSDSSTNQVGEFLELDKSDQDWAAQLEDFDKWAANILKDDDNVNWVMQPADMLAWQEMDFATVDDEIMILV